MLVFTGLAAWDTQRLKLLYLQGAGDPEVVALVADIFSETPSATVGRGILVEKSYSEVLRWIDDLIPRDVVSSVTPLQVLHRRLEAQDVFYCFNPAETDVAAEVGFRVVGAAEQWDAWTAAVSPLNAAKVANGVSTLIARPFSIWPFSAAMA